MTRRKKLLFLGIGVSGVFGLAIPAIMLGGSHIVGILDSSAFCTQVCHDVHYAEATTCNVSAHSEVACASCHVGTGTGNLVRSKLSGVKDIVPQLTHGYTLPIKTTLDDLRPSSETCEKCHYAEKFPFRDENTRRCRHRPPRCIICNLDLRRRRLATRSAKSPQELYQEREKRIADVVSLKVPDRVPLRFSLAYFPAKYCGITTKAAFYDAVQWKWACKKTLLDFDADCYLPSTGVGSGEAMEILGVRTVKWPGHGVSDYSSHQSIEMEPMKQEEYDEFLADPSDFIMHKFLPRVCDAGSALTKWPSFRSLTSGNSLSMLASRFADPEQIEFHEKMVKAGKAASAMQKEMSTFDAEMEALGHTNLSPGGAGAPFDIISDSLRGMRGAMMDMYRCPDKLIKVCEMYVKQSLDRAAAFAKNSKNKRVFMALHRGSDGFMSLDQFKTFYWPTYKQVVMGLIDMGLTPVPFYEGIWNQRLEFLREFPKGKTIAHFAQSDMKKAKEVLGGHTCIMGDVPSSILQVGTVSEVEDYCKKLIDNCGKDGGLIVTHMPIDEADPKLVKAMIDFTRKYGVYN